MPLPGGVADGELTPDKPESPAKSASNPRDNALGPVCRRVGGEMLARTISPSASSLDAPAPADDPKPGAGSGATLEEGDRLFTAGKYLEAGECYAASPARIGCRPIGRNTGRTAAWSRSLAESIFDRDRARVGRDRGGNRAVSSGSRPNIWYGEYLRSKVAEVRKSGRRPLGASRITWSARNRARRKPARRTRRPIAASLRKRSWARGERPSRAAAPPAPAASPEVLLNLPGDSSPSPSSRRPLTQARQTIADTRMHRPDAATVPALDRLPGLTRRPATIAATDGLADLRDRQFSDLSSRRSPGRGGRAGRRGRACGPGKTLGKPGRAATLDTRVRDLPVSHRQGLRPRTEQPEDSPGFSTIESNGNRVITRRMNLRADHPQVLAAILPHEVTHVVLADLFTTQQIPRWADEGIAVLSEPSAEQEPAAAELHEPLEAGRVFDLRKLMSMDYPDAKDWSLYYAQSVSLDAIPGRTRTARAIDPVRAGIQRKGIEAAFAGTYRIGGFAELQERWTECATAVAPVREASRDPVLNLPEPRSNDSARTRPSTARRSPARSGRARSTRSGPDRTTSVSQMMAK